jgi:hypothetical protein
MENDNMKLTNVQAYPIENVPDHLTHECSQIGIEMGKMLMEKFKDKSPNVFLGGMGFAYAAMIKNFISDDPEQLKKAAALYALGIIKNVELLANFKIIPEE